MEDSDRDLKGTAENIAVRDNPGESRYELVLHEHVVGEIAYRLTPDHTVLIHTEVLPSLENKGLGARLVAGALDDIRARGLRVVPSARSCARTSAATPTTPISSCGT